MYIGTCVCLNLLVRQSVNLSLVVVRSFLHLSPVFFSRCLLHRHIVLFLQSHHVLLLGLVHNTYLDHAVLIDIHVVIKNDVEKVIRIVAHKCIDRFSREAIVVVLLMVVVLISFMFISGTLISTTPKIEFSIEWASLFLSLAGCTTQTCGSLALPCRYGMKRRRVAIAEPDTMKRTPMRRRVMNDMMIGAAQLDLLHCPRSGLCLDVHDATMVLQ